VEKVAFLLLLLLPLLLLTRTPMQIQLEALRMPECSGEGVKVGAVR
jgi:hypothetical protein